jgi:glutamate racemase
VEAVEAGAFDTPETHALLWRELEPLLAAGADTLVLGCTHFPALREPLQRLAGSNVTLIDTGEAVARRALALLGSTKGESGALFLATTGVPEVFSRGAQAILRAETLPIVRALYWKDGRLENA